MKHICIVGAGAAGLLVLYNLEKHNIDPSWITLIDPTHSGGDLRKKWFHVKSNTTWRQIFEALPSRNSFAQPWSSLQPEEPVELHLVSDYLRASVKEYMSKVNLRTDTVKSVTQDQETFQVTLAHAKQPLVADIVFFCQGAEPKSLDLPFPSIPLEVALDSRRLSDYVQPGQHVLVFGTAHSGPLVVKNLADLNVRITNFYATEKPFYFARDGEYDGIKQDAAQIADKMLSGEIPSLSLDSVQDLSAILRASKTADACVYACGFEPRSVNAEWKLYNGETGRIEGTQRAWGFGIAYPNKAPDGIHWDVSIPAFQVHIQKQMPDILAALQC
jgi:cation diffusion facilitator CzcD-associated flavoprotein CzcO